MSFQVTSQSFLQGFNLLDFNGAHLMGKSDKAG